MIKQILILSTCYILSFAFCFAEPQNDPRINEVLTYWFGDLKTKDDYPQDRSKIWFGGGVHVDQEIRDRFEHLVLDAANHKLDEWKQTPKGRLTSIFESHADYARRHHVIIKKFGRFPHRNAIMGRESTPEELEFLKGPHSSF